jgi:hypothetical protein
MSRTEILDEACRLQVGGLRRPMQGEILVKIGGPGRSVLQALYGILATAMDIRFATKLTLLEK